MGGGAALVVVSLVGGGAPGPGFAVSLEGGGAPGFAVSLEGRGGDTMLESLPEEEAGGNATGEESGEGALDLFIFQEKSN